MGDAFGKLKIKMTQDEVLKLLKAEDKWMTAREIGKMLNTGPGSIGANLNKLLSSGDVVKEERTAAEGGFLWKIKETKEPEEEQNEEI